VTETLLPVSPVANGAASSNNAAATPIDVDRTPRLYVPGSGPLTGNLDGDPFVSHSEGGVRWSGDDAVAIGK
jgi:hypothetical protein